MKERVALGITPNPRLEWHTGMPQFLAAQGDLEENANADFVSMSA